MNHSSLPSMGPDDGLRYPAPWALWTLRLLCVVALAISGYLAWAAFQTGSLAGCSSGGTWSCEHVLHSKWSKVFGIPVSIPALALYTSLLSCLVFAGVSAPERVRNLAWSLVTILAVSAGVAAVWFISLQAFVLKHFCPYCMGAHTVGLLACSIVLWTRPLDRKIAAACSGLGVLATSLLVLAQVFSVAPPTHQIEVYEQVAGDASSEATEEFVDFDFDVAADAAQFDGGDTEGQLAPEMMDVLDEPTTPTSLEKVTPPAGSDADGKPLPTLTPQPPVGGPVTTSDGPTAADLKKVEKVASKQVPDKRLIKYPGVRANLNVDQWPIIGSSAAPHVVIELFDYTCPHCREMNRQLEIAKSLFGDQLAIIVLPVPLSPECNQAVQRHSAEHAEACEIARLAVAVWRVSPQAFPQFHRWLFSENRNRTAAEARGFGSSLVGATQLQQEMAGPLVGKFIDRHVALYRRAGEGTLPKLLCETMTLEGKMRSADELCATLQSRLGMVPLQ